MPKQLKFDEDARAALLRGVNILAVAVKATTALRQCDGISGAA